MVPGQAGRAVLNLAHRVTASLLRPSCLHKLAYHAQTGMRSCTSLVSPDLYTDTDRNVTREKRKLK
jgi:hypothetical protein